MTDFEQIPPSGSSPEQRIGDPERQSAITALDAHREAVRLSAEEFEDRQVSVGRARTWADLQSLFRDLPAPYPAQMPSSPSPGQQLARSMQPPPVDEGLLAGVIPHRYRATVMALTPFIALVLFFTTETWLWFLLIPVMGVLLYGPGGHSGRDRDRNRQRRRNR